MYIYLTCRDYRENIYCFVGNTVERKTVSLIRIKCLNFLFLFKKKILFLINFNDIICLLLEYVVLDDPSTTYGPSLIEIDYSEGEHAEIQESDDELDDHHHQHHHHHVIETLENDCDIDDVEEDTHEDIEEDVDIDYIGSNESEHDFHRIQGSPSADFNEINIEYIDSVAATNDNPIDSTITEEKTAAPPRKDIVSYQRFGRLNTKILANPSFKCHLCGFSCCFKESLLNHFNMAHPQ